jgi:hypothetical protein
MFSRPRNLSLGAMCPLRLGVDRTGIRAIQTATHLNKLDPRLIRMSVWEVPKHQVDMNQVEAEHRAGEALMLDLRVDLELIPAQEDYEGPFKLSKRRQRAEAEAREERLFEVVEVLGDHIVPRLDTRINGLITYEDQMRIMSRAIVNNAVK